MDILPSLNHDTIGLGRPDTLHWISNFDPRYEELSIGLITHFGGAKF